MCATSIKISQDGRSEVKLSQFFSYRTIGLQVQNFLFVYETVSAAKKKKKKNILTILVKYKKRKRKRKCWQRELTGTKRMPSQWGIFNYKLNHNQPSLFCTLLYDGFLATSTNYFDVIPLITSYQLLENGRNFNGTLIN